MCTWSLICANYFRFNIQNLNKQSRLYQQGLTPMIKTCPGRGAWERLRDRPEYEVHVYMWHGWHLVPYSKCTSLGNCQHVTVLIRQRFQCPFKCTGASKQLLLKVVCLTTKLLQRDVVVNIVKWFYVIISLEVSNAVNYCCWQQLYSAL